jgi:hypothetical protein
MKKLILISIVFFSFSCGNQAEKSEVATEAEPAAESKRLFLDVHNLEPGKVTFEGVAEAHQKDLNTQGKYGANFIKYWVDEKAGKVYCLVEAQDSAAVAETHKEAHGLIPDFVHLVSGGQEAPANGNRSFFLDIHKLDHVTAEDVAGAHVKDLATQDKYGVNFINYWVDEKSGIVACLSEAKDSTAVINTHKEAHGLIPAEIHAVKQGQ